MADPLVWGITGGMGAGKTWLTEQLWLGLNHRSVECTLLRLDNLRYTALRHSFEPDHMALRERLSKEFKVPLDQDGLFDYRELCSVVMATRMAHQTYSGILSPVLVADAAAAIQDATGPVFLEWAMLLEDGFGELVNGPVVLVTCPDAEKRRRWRSDTWFSAKEVAARVRLQPSDPERVALAESMGVELLQLDTGVRAVADAKVGEFLDRLAPAPGPTPR